MKSLNLIIVIFLLFSCTEAKVRKGIFKDKLFGNVSMVTESFYTGIERFGETQKNGIDQKWVYKYDINGNLTEVSWYFSDGSLHTKKTYKYDVNGNMLEDNYLFSSENNNTPIIRYKYNIKGNMTEKSHYRLDGSLISKIGYEYDNKDNKTSKAYLNPDGKTEIIETYDYDDKGNMTVNGISGKDTYNYDNKGNIIEHNSFRSDGSLSEKESYRYNGKGIIVEHKILDSDGSYKSIELFDDRGNPIEKNSYGYLNTYKYNEKGFVTEHCIKKSDNPDDKAGTKSYKYESFDKNGNWTKRIEIDNFMKSMNSEGVFVTLINTNIVEREIEYY